MSDIAMYRAERERQERDRQAWREMRDRIEKLKEQLTAKDEEIKRLQECCTKYGKKVMRQDANMLKVIARNREQRTQIAKWKQTAIEERYNYLDLCDPAYYPDGNRPDYRAQAAKELGLEQEASYIDRLETAYIELKVTDAWDETFGEGGAKEHIERAHAEAQAALAKIREGKI